MKIKAKKQFGQNFLKDERVLDKIIESMPINSNKIVEIGPGLGDLTKRLVKCKDVIAYEVDKDLYSILQTKFQDMIQKEEHKLGYLLRNAATHYVDFEDEKAFLNLNHPHEYQEALSLLTQ